MISKLLDNNLSWAAGKTHDDPHYFLRLSEGQRPEYLWIGCSDSRVPANEVVGMQPGELFVHRNVANLAPIGDLNLMAVLQFAIESLEVRHIIVCGHYGCGGIRAAMDNARHRVLDHWLQRVQRICEDHRSELQAIHDPDMRANLVAELNVLAQVRSLARNPYVTDAWCRRQPLALHGWVYSIRDGLLRDLETTISSRADADLLFSSPQPSRRRQPAGRAG